MYKKAFKTMRAFCFLFLFLMAKAARNGDDIRGPYRSVLISAKRCLNSTYPLAKDPPIHVTMVVTGSGSKYRLLGGNITMDRDTKQVKLKIKSFTWDGGRWKLTYLMSAISCRSSLLDLFCKAFGLQLLDPTRCVFLKGTYSFSGIDINTSHHLFASKMEYGRTMWRSEVIVGFSTYQCWELQTLVEPI